jgi:hypothetical protein
MNPTPVDRYSNQYLGIDVILNHNLNTSFMQPQEDSTIS